jgi:hypothetical protein
MTPEEQAAADQAVKAAADKVAADKAAADKVAADNKGKNEEDKQFTREYVERLRKEAKDAKDAAKALADAAAQRESDEAKAKDDQKKVAELAEKRAIAAEKKLAETTENANKRLISTELRSLAREAGIVDIDDIKLLDAKDVTVDDDGEVIGAKAIIDAFKAAKPHKFKAADGGNTNKGGNDEAGKKRTPSTNTNAAGTKTDFSDKSTVDDTAFEKAWSTAGRAK